MGILQEQLDNAIKDAPRVALARLIEEKLQKRGIVAPEIVEDITTAILCNEKDASDIEVDLTFDLEFNEDDNKRLRNSAKQFIGSLPELINSIANEVGRDVANEFNQQWLAQRDKAALERDEVRRKIARRWGEAFSNVRLLIELCVDHGDSFNRTQLTSQVRRNSVRNEVLSRLHIRACRIANEIVTLLESGFTEGATARWRTMFEVSVTALLIADGGDPVAQRYLDHEAADRKKALDDHDRVAAVLGTGGVKAEERKEIEADVARFSRKYGSSFRGMYGWAANQLGLGNQPQFHDLQEVAGVLAMKLEYRLASLGTHASPRMLSQPMHQWDPTLHVPGVFAAGFEGPAINAAYTLVQITSALFSPPWDLDKLTQMKALVFLRDDLEAKLLSTARKIEREEQRQIERAIRRAGRSSPIYRRPR